MIEKEYNANNPRKNHKLVQKKEHLKKLEFAYCTSGKRLLYMTKTDY